MDLLRCLRAKFMSFYLDGIPNSRRSSTSLCPTCRSILGTESRRCRYRWDKEYVLHQSVAQLRLSASNGCHLCCLRWNDLATPGMISDSELPATGKVAFTKSGLWDPNDREDKTQARWRRDLLFSHDLEYGSMEKINTESGLPYLENYGEKDNLVSPLSQYQPSLDGSLTVRTQYCVTKNSVSWDTLRSWLVGNPEELHDSAFQDEDSSFLPTRLIYLGSGSVIQPRLCETQNLPRRRGYMTLSRCPADYAMLRLSVENMKHLKQLIPTQLLSPTHLDAMLLAQKLGIRYLWIDSLCVIQDSPADSAYESTLVRDIYGYTICNLAALDSASGSYVILGGLHIDSELDPQGLVVTIDRNHATSYVDNGESRGEFYEKDSMNPNEWEVQRIDLEPRILWGD